MAIYHCSVRILSRAQKQNAVAAAAYRSGQAILDKSTGLTHDYRRRTGVVDTAILLPADAPLHLHSRAALWNAAEASEKRKNARVAREIIIALPHEMDRSAQFDLVLGFVRELVERYSVAADVAVHEPCWKDGHDKRNYHAHILITTREITSEGFGAKTRILDDKVQGPLEIEAIRRTWEERANRHMEEAGIDQKIDRRSLAAQGIDRVPQIHRGRRAQALHDKGVKPGSVVKVDFRKREINYPAIDKGRTRPQMNADIVDLAQARGEFAALPLSVQIKNIERLIAVLGARLEELEQLLPFHLLPDYIRARLIKFWLRIRGFLIEALFKEQARIKERQSVWLDMRVWNMRQQLRELERKRDTLMAAKAFFAQLELTLAAMNRRIEMLPPSNPFAPKVTRSYMSTMIRAEAEYRRKLVPPEYRPSLPLWREPEKDNGGLVRPPPSLLKSFNRAAPMPAQKLHVPFKFDPG